MRARVDGAALRRARRARGLTQAELAEAVGVAGKERVSAWEHGTHGPQVGLIPMLAEVLGVPASSLLRGDRRNRLRELRWATGMSVAQVAGRIHVSGNTYQRWETGTRAFPDRPEVVRQLAGVLGVTPEQLRHAIAGVRSPHTTDAANSGDAGRQPRPDGPQGVDEFDGEGLPRLAEQLNHLFAAVPRSAGSQRPHSNDSAAQALEDYGIRVTGAALAHFRAGRRTNPSARLLAGVARLFGVPVDYFFDAELERDVNSRLSRLVTARDEQVRALLMEGVSPRRLEHVEGILDQIRRLQRLTLEPQRTGADRIPPTSAAADGPSRGQQA